MKIRKKLVRFCSILGLLIVILALGGSSLAGFAAADVLAAADHPDNGGLISGKVTSPGGYPLPAGTLIKLFEAGSDNVHGLAAPNLHDGIFQLGPVPNGLYVLKAVPPINSGYTQSFPKAFSVVNAPVNLGLVSLTEPQIEGSVYAPNGSTLVDAEVLVYLGDGQVLQKVFAPSGQFLVGGLPVGGYTLQAFPVGDLPLWKSHPLPISVPALSTPEGISLNLRSADLWGYARDQYDNPIALARVFASAESGEQGANLSNGNGFWSIGGLADGDYLINALPPWSQGDLIPPETIAVTLPGAANPYILAFGSPPKQVLGFVTTNTGLQVNHAQIEAHRLNLPGQARTLSGADGGYQLDLAPGLWALTVHQVSDTHPSEWVYPLPPQLVYFEENVQPETRQQDFEVVTADAGVIGAIIMPDGSPPPFTVTVSLHNDEGIGRRTTIDPVDGSFSLNLPNGSYKVNVHPEDNGHLGPVVDAVTLSPNEIVDLGSLTLLQRDAVISGFISSDGVGTPGIPVVAWRPGAPGSLHTTSGPGGVYALAVSAGVWHVQPAPGPQQPYLYRSGGARVELEAGELVEEIDFLVLATDATIQGVLVDESGNPVADAYGWAVAFQVDEPAIYNGAPIDAGAFTIHVPAGEYNVIANLPAGGPYTSAAERRVTVSSGGSVEVRLPIEIKDARIAGALWDVRNEDVIEGVAGVVGAWSDGNWAVAPIDVGNGSYQMGVSAGLWHMDYRIDSQAGYVKLNGPINVPAPSESTAIVPLKIVEKDGWIEGLVLGLDGSPLAGAKVFAKGAGLQVNDLWLKTQSAEDGSFALQVPYGRYRLGAACGHPDWIKPAEYEVEVLPGGVSSGHILQFRQPDVRISGILSVNNFPGDGIVSVWAWAQDGGFTQGRFPVTQSGLSATGTYQLGLLSNMDWNLGAALETSDQYWYGHIRVTMEEGDLVQDITLEGPFSKPAPVVVTFDAATPQHISLADGTHIYIPAGAMPVRGQVTLRIVPIATLPYQQHANILRYAYSFLATDQDGEPIEAHFNQDVFITFTYEEADLFRQHILEDWLKPAYFSTTTNHWTFPESFVVDSEANRVVMMIDHFTEYALTGVQSASIYLPLMIR